MNTLTEKLAALTDREREIMDGLLSFVEPDDRSAGFDIFVDRVRIEAAKEE